MDLTEGQMIEVQLDRHDEPKVAKVITTPPYVEKINNEEIEYTECVRVEYPGTSIDPGFFTDIQENVSLDQIVSQ